MKISLLGFAACLLFATLISRQVLTTTYHLDHNISITLSESDVDMTIKAKFPLSKSSEVNTLLIHYFKLNESKDLKSADISVNQIPGQAMNFNVQSKPGSLKMVMLKSKNASTVVSHLKDFGEKLKGVLTM
jgi:hypothetical protein